jgi:cell division protein ZapE
MDWQMENQARRFVNLVDEFYDRSVKLDPIRCGFAF